MVATTELGRTHRRSKGAASHGYFLTGALFFGVLGVVLPLGLATSVPSGPAMDWGVLLVQLSVIVYTALRLASSAAAGKPAWFLIVVFGYAYTWLGLTPMVQYLARQNPLGVQLDNSTYALQSIVVLVGLVAFDVVYHVRFREKPARAKGSTKAFRLLDTRRVVILALIAVASTPVFVQALGGFDVLFTSRQARTEVLLDSGLYSASSKASGAIVTAVASVLPFVALYAMTMILVYRRELRRKVDFVALYFVVVCCNIALNNPISSSRFWFLVVCLSVLFVFPWARSAAGVRAIIGGFVLGSIVLFPYLDAFRYSDGSRENRGVIQMILEKSDYDSMVQIGNSIKYADVYGYSFGDNFVGAFFFWVPRMVWPDKPIDTGSSLAQFVNYHHENLSAPLWAESYIAFGLVAVVGIFGVFGYLCGRLSRVDAVQRAVLGTISGWTFILVPLSVYVVLILRGSLLQSMSRLAVLVAVLLFCTASFKAEIPEESGRGSASSRNGEVR